MIVIDSGLLDRLYRQAKCERWLIPKEQFAETLRASSTRAFGQRDPSAREVERHLTSLHLEDLALACACAAGSDHAWEYFVREYRPLLYRAADAIDPGGGARDLADALYGDLFGLRSGAAAADTRSLFRYFHGRSSLMTWLRAVLAQRHVDRIRADRRSAPIPDDDSPLAIPAPSSSFDPDRARFLNLIRGALNQAVAALAPRDRLRLACYYGQQLTLSETGRVLGEHEATASRGLARTRAEIRTRVETELRAGAGLTDEEVARCFECVTEDTGSLDLTEILDMKSAPSARKESARDRSQ